MLDITSERKPTKYCRERTEQLARHQTGKHFWEGLRENLDLHELEVAEELQGNHLRHRKDDEECRHLANEVNTLFKKQMKSVPDPWEVGRWPPRYEPQQQPESQPQETNVTRGTSSGSFRDTSAGDSICYAEALGD